MQNNFNDEKKKWFQFFNSEKSNFVKPQKMKGFHKRHINKEMNKAMQNAIAKTKTYLIL